MPTGEDGPRQGVSALRNVNRGEGPRLGVSALWTWKLRGGPADWDVGMVSCYKLIEERWANRAGTRLGVSALRNANRGGEKPRQGVTALQNANRVGPVLALSLIHISEPTRPY